jgi:hypothetical protein
MHKQAQERFSKFLLQNQNTVDPGNLRGVLRKLGSLTGGTARNDSLGSSDTFKTLEAHHRSDSSTSDSQSGRLSTSRGLGPSAAPTMPSRSIRSMRWAARP